MEEAPAIVRKNLAGEVHTFTQSHKETAVRTANLGTMYQITYDIVLKNAQDEKKLIDALRMRNGNLPIIAGSAASAVESM